MLDLSQHDHGNFNCDFIHKVMIAVTAENKKESTMLIKLLEILIAVIIVGIVLRFLLGIIIMILEFHDFGGR